MDKLEETPKYLDFPRCCKAKRWNQYMLTFMDRYLTHKEHDLLMDLRSEIEMNKTIQNLQGMCMQNGIQIAGLTNLYGDCLFESLLHHGIGQDVKSLRAGLASVMHIFRKKNNFFPGQDETLEDLFVFCNEVEYSKSREPYTVDGKTHHHIQYHVYNYDTMLQDLANLNCWDALPTQLILMVISFLYKLEIVIIHSNPAPPTVINQYQNVENPPPVRRIYLGLLGEAHYIPAKEITDMDDIKPPQYNHYLTKFIDWASDIEKEAKNRWRINKYNAKKQKEEEDEKNEQENGDGKTSWGPKADQSGSSGAVSIDTVGPVESSFVDFGEFSQPEEPDTTDNTVSF